MVRIRRRRLLGGLGGLAALLAGCSTSLPSDGTGGSANGSVFRSVNVEGVSLVVTLESSADVDGVNVVAPDGSAFAQQSVPEGVTTVEIEIGTDYEPGEFRVLGVRDGEAVGETSLDITPNIEILEVGIGANNLDRMPEELGTTQRVEALVRIRNTGTGPESVMKLEFSGDVPNPTSSGSEGLGDSSGIFDVEQGQGEVSSLVIEGGQETTLYSSTLPFSFQGEGVDCSGESKTGSASIYLHCSAGENVVMDYEVQYSASESYNECAISIVSEET